MKRAEGRAPAELQALVLVFLEEKAGPPVAERGEPLERAEHRAVVIRAHGVQRGPFDDVVGVDAGEARPVEIREVGLVPRRQQNHAVDAARLEDRIEAVHGKAVGADDEFFDFEPELGRALQRAGDEFGVILRGVVRPVGLVEIHRGEHAAKRRAA